MTDELRQTSDAESSAGWRPSVLHMVIGGAVGLVLGGMLVEGGALIKRDSNLFAFPIEKVRMLTACGVLVGAIVGVGVATGHVRLRMLGVFIGAILGGYLPYCTCTMPMLTWPTVFGAMGWLLGRALESIGLRQN